MAVLSKEEFKMKNILITGKPRSGKTTLIKEVIKELDVDAGGFYTSEIREKGKRVGFAIESLERKKGVLAHKAFESLHRVGSYKVNIKDLEEIGVDSILEALKEGKLIVVDELGKMEMKSSKFKKAVLAALASENKVLGTIKLTPDPFTDKIRKRKDVEIFYLTKENKEKVKKEIIRNLARS